jgi:hypothetical protein
MVYILTKTCPEGTQGKVFFTVEVLYCTIKKLAYKAAKRESTL